MRFPRMEVAALAAVLLAACGGQSPARQASADPASQSAQALTKIAVGYPNFRSAHIPLWVAKEANIFEQNGIDADLRYSAANVAIDSLVARDTQFCSCSGTALLSPATAGVDLVTIATVQAVNEDVLEAVPAIKTAADLKGKKVRITGFGTQGETYARMALLRLGLDPDKDVTLVVIGSPNPIAAFESGAIQAALATPPDSLVLDSLGYNTLLSLADLRVPQAGGSVIVQRAYLNSHHELAQRYVDSLVQATARAKRDKPFTINVMKKYQKTDDERLLSATYEFYFGKELISSLPYPAAEQLTDSVDEIATTNPNIRSLDLNALIDTSFVKSAADRGLDH